MLSLLCTEKRDSDWLDTVGESIERERERERESERGRAAAACRKNSGVEEDRKLEVAGIRGVGSLAPRSFAQALRERP